MMNVNFMGKLPTSNNIATVLEADAKKFFPHSAPVETATKGVTEGVTKAQIESFLASRKNLPTNISAAIEETQAKAAGDAYARAHGIPIK